MTKILYRLLLTSTLIYQTTSALQFSLLTMEPMCIQVEPQQRKQGLTVSYVSTGVNEDQVSFTARQNGELLYSIKDTRDHQANIQHQKQGKIELCWTKLDKKAKKITFLIQQKENTYDQKATVDTVEGLQQRIEGLENSLDQIALNIVMQREIEKEHFELTKSTSSNQGWMSFLKLAAIICICSLQVYLTTAFFNQKNKGLRGSQRDNNPFATSVI